MDFEKLRQRAKRAARSAAQRTDEKLASDASSLTSFTDEEIQELFPKPADVEKLARLMAIVRSAESDNRRLLNLKKNFEDLGGTILKLLDTLA
jgi:hypothetical protein